MNVGFVLSVSLSGSPRRKFAGFRAFSLFGACEIRDTMSYFRFPSLSPLVPRVVDHRIFAVIFSSVALSVESFEIEMRNLA